MAIDKIFNDANVDGIADNIFGAVNNSVSEVKQMQQRKAAENVQMVVEAFKKIETNITEKFDNVTDVIEKRVLTIKDGRDGSSGSDGRNGRDGKPGRDGVNGKQGTPGTPGKDGTDGVDGVSVTDANIDFDGSLVISLSTGQQINVGEIVPPELERQLVELRQGGGSAGSSGDVAGPTSSTDNAIVRFDGTTGKVVQNSVVTIADTTGNMAGVGTLGVGAITTTGALVGTATQNAFNTVSTTLNLGGAATAVNIGAATGTLTVANTTLAAKAITASTTLGVTGVSTLTAGAVVQGMTVGLGGGSVATNTVVGATALSLNTTGYANTATGHNALHENTTGIANTAIGSSSLYYNTLGDQNVAIGAGSALNNISGIYNTVGGNGAMQSNATGSRNTVFGNAALLAYTPPVVTAGAFVIATAYTIVTVGTTNFVAIGASANTVGVMFTATGAGSGTGTASTNVDATNTVIGYASGSAITTGIKNTIIGAYTGNQGGLDIRTASNYIVLSDGDGNPRAYWNGASATFNGGLAIAGTLSATGNTSLATTPVLYSGDGGVSSGRLVGRYSYRDATPATPYFYDFTNSNTITPTDALAVSKFPTTINTGIVNANALTAFGTSYGTKAAGLSFVSGTSSDVLLASLSSPPLLNADINAVIVGYTSNGPRIAIQNYALNDDTANAISYVGAVHRFYPAGTEVVNISSTGLAVTGTLSATGTSTLAAVNASGEIRRNLASDAVYSASALNADHGLSVYNSSVTTNSFASLEFVNRAAGTAQAGISSVTPSANNSVLAFQVMTSNVISEPMRLSGTALALGVGISLTGGTSGTGYSFSGSAPAGSLTLNSSGNLGLGVAPNVGWGGSFKAIQVGDRSAIVNVSNSTLLSSNYYNNGTNDKYILAAAATVFQQVGGEYRWLTSTGTPVADGIISFTQAMTLDASGNLLVGTTTAFAKLAVIVAGGANRDLIQAGVTSATDGLTVKWNHATSTIRVNIQNLPTSATGLASGDLYNLSGVLMVA